MCSPSDLSATPELDELAARAARQDRQALCDLVRIATPRLRAFLARSVVNTDELEEGCQQVWLKVAGRIHTYDPSRPTGFLPWLLAVARNCQIDQRRKKRPQHGLPDADVEGGIGMDGDHQRQFDNCELVAMALAGLNSEQRELIYLRYWEGLTVAEMAHRLDQGYNSLKARVHRAQQQLLHRIRHFNDGSSTLG